MRNWELTIALDRRLPTPLYLQLASSITDSIRSGRLDAGAVLPGSRELAQRLGVNRNTVVAGYAELAAEGIIRARPGGGTFVAEPQDARPSSRPQPIDEPTFALAPPLAPPPCTRPLPPGVLMMSAGLPDARLFPALALARAFRRAIQHRGRGLLSYAGSAGHARLRHELANMLCRTRGLRASAGNVMVTRSIEQGIDLVARALLSPGDVVAVEAFGYPPAWSVLKMAGARLVPLPVGREGLDVDALESLLARTPLRAVFLTPHHQFPTAAVMSSRGRERLARLSLRHGFAILEDDYDHEFHYDGNPILPIAAGTGRPNTIYLGSLANLLAPGMSTGFMMAPPPVFERLLGVRAATDARCDAAAECAIAELFEDGELLRHLRRMRRTYASRRDALCVALRHHLGSALEFEPPQGGMAIWARVDRSIDLDRWVQAGERNGVQFASARAYDFHQRDLRHVRLGFSYHDEAELEEAVRRMAVALGSAQHRGVLHA
jgi:GntR family transcriptional regulator/MocR family aminotransferase